MQLVWVTLIALALVSAIQGAYMIFSEYIAHPVVVSYFIQEAGMCCFPHVQILVGDISLCINVIDELYRREKKCVKSAYAPRKT